MRVLDNDQEEFAQSVEASNKPGSLMLQGEPSSRVVPAIEAGEAHNRIQTSQSEDVVTEISNSQSAYSEVEPFAAVGKERGEVMEHDKRSRCLAHTLCFSGDVFVCVCVCVYLE